ncbi:MAG: hypothetical protein OXO50_02285, partial [Caldilineaceae bacterium]|nr:hypothetical protein [Caldilineaceae bacterium]
PLRLRHRPVHPRLRRLRRFLSRSGYIRLDAAPLDNVRERGLDGAGGEPWLPIASAVPGRERLAADHRSSYPPSERKRER